MANRRSLKVSFVTLALVLVAVAAHGQGLVWTTGSYRAQDVAVGANGSVWFIATDGTPNGSIFQMLPSGPKQVPGNAARIAVDPSGNPWVVNASNEIYRWTGTAWQQMPGAGHDIGIGANGVVFVAGTDNTLYRWTGSSWTQFGGGNVTSVSVDPSGNPWVVNSATQIYRHTGSAWEQLPGNATDIGVGADGSVYVIGMNQVTGGGQIYKWDPSARNWQPQPEAGGARVAAGAAGQVLVARSPASNLPVLQSFSGPPRSFSSYTSTGTTGSPVNAFFAPIHSGSQLSIDGPAVPQAR